MARSIKKLHTTSAVQQIFDRVSGRLFLCSHSPSASSFSSPEPNAPRHEAPTRGAIACKDGQLQDRNEEARAGEAYPAQARLFSLPLFVKPWPCGVRTPGSLEFNTGCRFDSYRGYTFSLPYHQKKRALNPKPCLFFETQESIPLRLCPVWVVV